MPMILGSSVGMWLLVATFGPQAPAPAEAPAPAPAPQSPWSAIQFLVGDWVGESEGKPGKGTVERTYRFVLRDRFLHERNVSTYPPQPRNEKGEVHEHWSLFSHDRARRSLVLRQFHQEGFVNQYVMALDRPAGGVVFESEALENIPSGWKARETYEIVNADEFVETFELAQGAGPYEVYSKNRFTRVRRPVGAATFRNAECDGPHTRGGPSQELR